MLTAHSKRLHPSDHFESWMFECISPAMEVEEAAAGQGGGVVTRPVFARLEGRVLTLWGYPPDAPRGVPWAPRVPRAALWSEDAADLRRARAALTHRRRYQLHGDPGAVTLLPDGLSRTRRWSRKYPICVVASEMLGEEEVDAVAPAPAAAPAPASAPASTPAPAPAEQVVPCLATATPEAADGLPSIVVSASSTPLASSVGPSAVSTGSPEVLSLVDSTKKTPSVNVGGTTPPSPHNGSPSASSTSSPTASPTTMSMVSSTAIAPASPTTTPTSSPTTMLTTTPTASLTTIPSASTTIKTTASTSTPPQEAQPPASAETSETATTTSQKPTRASLSSGSDVSDLSVNFADVTGVRDVEDVEERLLGGLMSEEIIGLVDDDVVADEAATPTPAPGAAPGAAPPPSTSLTLLLLARTARQKEEWYRRLRRAAGEACPLDDAALLEDYVVSLQQYLDDGDRGAAEADVDPSAYQGLNALAGRVLFDACHSARWAAAVQAHVQRRLASVRVPAYIQQPTVSAVHCRHAAVRVLRVGQPRLDAQGLWVDLDVSYRGVMRFVVTSRLNLTAQHQQQTRPRPSSHVDARASATDQDEEQDDVVSEPFPLPPALSPMLQPRSGTWRLFKRLAESRFFQAALAALSNTDIVLVVEVRALDGVLCVHVPPPPSDRVWLGFRGVPCLRLAAVPRVGTRTLRHALLCRLVERRLRAHMERVLVLPNMANILLPFT
ncbi:Testis-expressed protein 2 [Frankliniella fusca]|uniref:Testis-expressed protein 2 n=1 Tax=Frankliniella fusca TaxID=407009 RepID=A0AAE1H4S0_9NEOP|nr:Testis-expressed protein 2 [Frankliniella fusca]